MCVCVFCVNVSHLHCVSVPVAGCLVCLHIKIKSCINILTSPRFCFCFISAALCNAVVILFHVRLVLVALLLLVVVFVAVKP